MRWLLVGVMAALALMIALLPMRMALRQVAPGLEAQQIDGSIWDGRLRSASYNGVPIGDLDAGLDAGRLLRGEASVKFERLGTRLAGRAGGTRHERRIDDLSGELPLDMLPKPVPPITLRFQDVTAHFGLRGNCLLARGVVTARIANVPLLGDTPELSGTARCEGDSIIIPMEAANGLFTLDLGAAPDGRWKAGFALHTDNAVTKGALQALGFSLTPTGVRLDGSGRFADLGQVETRVRQIIGEM